MKIWTIPPQIARFFLRPKFRCLGGIPVWRHRRHPFNRGLIILTHITFELTSILWIRSPGSLTKVAPHHPRYVVEKYEDQKSPSSDDPKRHITAYNSRSNHAGDLLTVEELRSRPRDTKLDTKPKQTSVDNSSWVRVWWVCKNLTLQFL